MPNYFKKYKVSFDISTNSKDSAIAIANSIINSTIGKPSSFTPENKFDYKIDAIEYYTCCCGKESAQVPCPDCGMT